MKPKRITHIDCQVETDINNHSIIIDLPCCCLVNFLLIDVNISTLNAIVARLHCPEYQELQDNNGDSLINFLDTPDILLPFIPGSINFTNLFYMRNQNRLNQSPFHFFTLPDFFITRKISVKYLVSQNIYSAGLSVNPSDTISFAGLSAEPVFYDF